MPEPDDSSTIRLGAVLFALVAILTMILDVRPFDDVGERFIGHADQADVALVARNIAEGNGPVTDVVWLLHGGGPPGPELRHPEGYWSIYQAAFMALFFKVWGANLQALLLTASVIKILIAALGFYWTYRFSRQAMVSAICGIILLTTPEINENVNGQSDLLLTLLILLTVTCLIKTLQHPSITGWALCGVCTGLAIGAKPSGLLLVGLIGVGLAVAPGWRPALRHVWAWALAVLATLTPLAIHNVQAAETINWPDLPVMRSALTQMDSERGAGLFTWNDPITIQAWNRAAYDPQTTLGEIAPRGWDKLLLHLQNLWGFGFILLAGQIIPPWVLPFVFFALVGWVIQRLHLFTGKSSEKPSDRDELYHLFVAATLILGIGACFLGAAVHTEARYFAFLIPLCVIVGLIEASRLSNRFVLFGLLFTLTLSIMHYGRHTARAVNTSHMAAYAALDEVLPEDAVVMTQDPWEFSFHLRRPSVVLPYNPNPSVLAEVAQRFNAEYLVVVGSDVRHPKLQYLNRGGLPPFLEGVHRSPGLIVARFKTPGPKAPGLKAPESKDGAATPTP